MQNKKSLIILAVAIVLVVGAVVAVAIDQNKQATTNPPASASGDGEEKVKFVFHYGGDGCDACLFAKSTLEAMAAEYSPETFEAYYYDMDTQADEAAANGVTKAHYLAATDSHGCTGQHDGTLGSTREEVETLLAELEMIPPATPAP